MKKELINKVKRFRKSLRGSREDHGLCTFAVLKNKKDPYIITFHDAPCHMALSRVECRESFAIIALVELEKIQKDRHAKGFTIPYYRWLLNDSPYAECFITKDAKEAIQYGIICKTNVPSNLLVGGLVASRYPWEYAQNNYRAWCELYKRGVHPSMAFVMCHAVYQEREGKLQWGDGLYGHNSMCPDRTSVEGILTFLKNNKDNMNLNANYNKDRMYSGILDTWAEGEGMSLKDLVVKGIGEAKGRGRKGLLGHRKAYMEPKLGYDLGAIWGIKYYNEVMT